MEWIWLILSRLVPPLLAAVVMLAVATVVAVGYFFHNAPVVLIGFSPYFVLHYPTEVIGLDVPPQQAGKVVVLLQRTLFDIDHWQVARDPSQCTPPAGQLTPCDESHGYGSWTVVVPEDGTKLYGISTSTGGIGEIVALTPHTIREYPPVGGFAKWEIINYNRPAGDVEVIAVRRDYYGGFQPVAKEKVLNTEPDISQCEEASASIVIGNPTARAELVIHTPPNLPINSGNFKFWSRRQGDVKPLEMARDPGYVFATNHNIYWQLANALLKEADNQRIVYKISWRWGQPITEGPVCGH